MLLKIVAGLSCLLVAASVLSNPKPETKQIKGEVKSIAADSMVITVDDKDWTFIIDKDTRVFAKGASHTSRKAENSKETTIVTDFVKVDEMVAVDYLDNSGKLTAVEVRVR